MINQSINQSVFDYTQPTFSNANYKSFWLEVFCMEPFFFFFVYGILFA